MSKEQVTTEKWVFFLFSRFREAHNIKISQLTPTITNLISMIRRMKNEICCRTIRVTVIQYLIVLEIIFFVKLLKSEFSVLRRIGNISTVYS